MSAAAMGGVPAEVLAERLLRKAWDGAYTPDLNGIADECALTRREVEAIRDRLLNARKPAYTDPGRVQTLARPSATHAPPSPPAATVAPAGAGEPPAWRAAADHPNVKVRRAVAKAAAAVDAVEQLLAAEAGKDELRRKEAKLAAQLAAVRAELRGAAAPKADPGEQVACTDCGYMATARGMAIHRGRTHKAPA
jgi:hypothetical protein